MRSTHAAVVLGLVTLAVGFAACGGGETGASTTTGAGGAPSTTGSSTTATTSGGDATSSSVTGTGGAGGATSSSASTGTGGPVYGYCTKPCGTVINCCPPSMSTGSSMACPSDVYPNNPTCVQGACHSAQCSLQTDCGAVNSNQDCLVLSGQHICGDTCTEDKDCTAAGTTCSGKDDTGKKYCLSAGGGGCSDDASCSGFGKCVNKLCVCEKAADCTKAGFTACAL